MDIPEQFNVTFYDKNTKYGVLSSKATGEPSCLMGVSVLLALKKAVKAIRTSHGEPATQWFDLGEKNLSADNEYKMTKIY